MINQLPPELFAQRPVRSEYARGRKSNLKYKRLIILGLAALVVVSGIGGGIYSYMQEDAPEDGEIAHIQAAYPIKERPEKPGGIDIPHQDVEVFEQLDNASQADDPSAMEHLLPGPETPQPVSDDLPAVDLTQAKAPQATVKVEEEEEELLPPAITEAVVEDEASPVSQIKELPPVNVEVAPVPNKVEENVKIEQPKPPVEASVKKEVVAKVVKPVVPKVSEQAKKADQALARLPMELFTGKEVPQTAVVSSPPVKAVTGPMARVQIASFPEEAAAKKEVGRYTKLFASSLSGVDLEVVRAEIPNKGTYYRIVTNQLSISKANSICDDMKKNKGSCLILR